MRHTTGNGSRGSSSERPRENPSKSPGNSPADRGIPNIAADANVKLSARNIEKVKTLPAAYLNVVDMLNAQGMVMTVDAVRGAEAMWGGERTKKRAAKVEA